MFKPVEDFEAFSKCSELRAYIAQLLGMSSTQTTATVNQCDKTLRELYGKFEFIDKYDGKNLGLGNIKKLVAELAKIAAGKSTKNDTIRLPLAVTQLNECASDLVNLLVSSNDSYTAFGNPNNQRYVAAVAKRMSDDFTRFDHFEALLKAIRCELYYGVAAIAVTWAEDSLNQINIVGLTENPERGVQLQVLNPANLYYSELPDMRLFSERGNFCAYIECIAKTEILSQSMHPALGATELTDIMHQCSASSIIDSFGVNNPQSYSRFLEFVPHSSSDDATQSQALNYAAKVTVYVRLCPELLGASIAELPPLTKTLLRLTFIGNTLINCEISDNGIMPIVIAPLFKGVATPAASLVPTQKFINFLINIKQLGDRKKIFGINFYDRNRINLNDITKAKEADSASPWIPVALREGESLGSAITHFSDAPDTHTIISDVANMKDLMQLILPTDQSSLMGNLDRATEWQAKKALETSGKATKLLAKQLQAALITPLKSLHIQTIFENEASLPVVDSHGNSIPAAIGEFAGKGVMYAITTALTGVDRDIKASQMDTFINKLIQLPAVTQEYDLTKLFDYQSSLTGHQIDFSMFKKESPIDGLPIEQRTLAYQLLEQYLGSQQKETNDVDQNQ